MLKKTFDGMDKTLGEVLLAPVRAYAENETKNITTGKFPKICACTLHNDAGVIGAAALGNSI